MPQVAKTSRRMHFDVTHDMEEWSSPVLLRIISRKAGLTFFCAVSVVISSLLLLVQPLALREFFNSIGDTPAAVRSLAVLVAAFIISAFCGALSAYLSATLGAGIELSLRQSIFSEFFSDERSTKDFSPINGVSLIINDASLIASGVTGIVTIGVGALFTFIGSISATLYFFPLAVATAAIFASISFILTFYIGGTLRKMRIRLQDQKSETMSLISDLLHASRQIKHYGSSDFYLDFARTSFLKLFRVDIDLQRKQAILSPFLEMSTKASFLAGVSVAALQVGLGNAGFGDFIAFSIYFQGLTSSLQQLLSSYVALQESKAGLDRVAQAFARKYKSKRHLQALKTSDSFVELSQVSFSYNKEQPVLVNCSFNVPSSGITALVGASGSGKSTLIKLILGELAPDEGAICFKTKISAKQKIGIVEQDTLTVPGTWEDNILFGRSNISKTRVNEVMCAVGLDKGLAMISDVLTKDISEASSGELQRLMLARALVGDPSALLLDEPTSSVDGRMEHLMIQTVKDLALSIPVLIVAHRPYTVRTSDRLLFLQDGRIVLQGTTDTCIESSSELRELLGEWKLNENAAF